MTMTVHAEKFSWRGGRLYYGNQATGFGIVQDQTYPSMWRVELPDKTRTDMVNRSRAKDAAQALATSKINMGASAGRPASH